MHTDVQHVQPRLWVWLMMIRATRHPHLIMQYLHVQWIYWASCLTGRIHYSSLYLNQTRALTVQLPHSSVSHQLTQERHMHFLFEFRHFFCMLWATLHHSPESEQCICLILLQSLSQSSAIQISEVASLRGVQILHRLASETNISLIRGKKVLRFSATTLQQRRL